MLAVSQQHRRGAHARRSPFTIGTALVACGLALAVTTAALTVGSTTGGAASAASATVEQPTRTATISSAPARVADTAPVIEALPAVASGPASGGTNITIAGANLAGVASATVGGQPAVVVSTTPDSVTIAAPAAPRYAEGTVAIDVFTADGTPVPVDLTPATTLADLGAPGAVAPALTFSYLPDEHIVAQTAYVLSHWTDYNPDFISLDGNDCVNFTSQGLLARGWTMDGEWWYNAGATSAPWVSSTAFSAYLSAHPERATYLGDNRVDVKVGDVVQFDWDRSGDLDHTTTVTRVDHTDNGVKVYVAGHTKDSDFWDVDEALATGGGTAVFWSIKTLAG
ncbi:MAG: amidase domain-containing protein [Leifsonia sp.]